MQRFLTTDASRHIGEKVKVAGWASVVRRHGKIVFVDLRDKSGVLQCVFTPQIKDAYEKVQEVRPEWVIEITGQIVKRPESMVNPKIETGTVELSVNELNVLARAETLPFSIETDGREIGEEIRLKYRYLDLRRERLKNNLIMRHKATKFVRDFLTAEGFIEVETPALTKSTPEGARDFVVPSRLHPGKFYALPQSPQQYKQLLMVAGIEKYFQIARVFRDEDTRGDRQAEHTQIDIEISFTTPEEVMSLVERMITQMVTLLYPHKKIKTPWPRVDYDYAIKKYGNDKPDLREDKSNPDEIAFAWIVNFPQFELDKQTKQIQPVHHMFVQPKEDSVSLIDSDPLRVISTQYDWVCNGYELASGSIRITDPILQMKIFKLLGMSEKKAMADFGHLLNAFTFGVPPHGGIAPGLDRLIMILQNEPNIREVIAFPKTGDGRDLMMNAPSDISDEQMKELSIKVIQKNPQKIPAKKQKKTKKNK